MQVKQENVRGMIGILLASIMFAVALPLKASAAESVTYLFPAPPQPAGLRAHKTSQGQRLFRASGH
jgi:hypothetical protein